MKTQSPLRYWLCCIVLLLVSYGSYLYMLDEHDLPPLEDGDLVFQTSWVPGAMAIGLASNSWYIHTGIIHREGSNIYVLHAGQTVTSTPFKEWLDYGIFRRFAVYRYKDMTKQQAKALIRAAKSYYGKTYDHYFSFENESIYCSELEYLAFKDAGMSVGTVERIGDLRINNYFVRKLIEQRWQRYPACMGKGYDFDTCYEVIMDGKLVTPSSIANDPRMTQIFTNYPW
jgi:hypothetical protein